MTYPVTEYLTHASLLAQGGGRNGGGMRIDTLWLVLLFGALIIALAFFAIFARYFRLWIQSVTTGAGIGILDLLRMTFRKVNPTVITRSKIMAVQAGIYDSEGLTTKGLEAHYLAGGNVPLVIRSMRPSRTTTPRSSSSDSERICIPKPPGGSKR